ncbi:hypothetical protein [Cellulomonas fimi]|uniref:hypothetical protein n=1 Tax=Cellulomonas fimi TaxID=1708 RepID=UPI0005A1AACF|nr:hypothetical protein [Cellulomonas fimi]NNH07587.1 hypothetical protein [Cellulomonas fimi]
MVAAVAYQELRRRLGQRLVEEERTSEHGYAHWDAYRLALEDPSLHQLLLEALRAEPAQGMALGPVFSFIEGDDPALAVSALGVLAPGSREQVMAEQRARDVARVRAAALGEAGSFEPADRWSRWAQHEASRTATDLRVLDLLASRGPSRRVRAQAAERARRCRKARGSSSSCSSEDQDGTDPVARRGDATQSTPES